MSGKTFVDAFTAKYLDQGSDDSPSELNDSGIIILCPKNKPSDVILLRRVVLDHAGITDVGDCSQVADKLQHCRELDLSANQLASWSQVEEILKFMPSLEFLNLASTSLSDSSRDGISSICGQMECVKILILNSTRLPWDTAVKLLDAFPSVGELHLSLNGYSSIPQSSTATSFSSVRRLYFNDNGVASWSDLAHLGDLFPSVTSLFLVKNPLMELTDAIGCHFKNLKQLSILDTALSDWEDIDNLNHFPVLVEVQLRGIPLLEGMEEKECRQLVVARIAKLAKLNNSPISGSDRENAERFFIRKYMDAPDKPRRYEELKAIHKNVNKLAHVDMGPITNASLVIRYGSEMVEMDVSTEQNCWQLRKSLATHFEVDHEMIQIFYHDGQYEGGYDEMRDDRANLQWYSVKNGDEILVKDLTERREREARSFWRRSTVRKTTEMSSDLEGGASKSSGQTKQVSERVVKKAATSNVSGSRSTPSTDDKPMKQLPVKECGHGECSFVEAFVAKYLLEEEEVDLEERYKNPHIHIAVQKKRPDVMLRVAILDQEKITFAGACEHIAGKLSNITELDLSGNRLGSWKEVEAIVFHMSRLELLNLASTDLSGEGILANSLHKASVKTVILTATNIPWITVMKAVIPSFPNLEEIHLSLNHFAAVPEPPGPTFVFPKIRQLYFNDNDVQLWSDIIALGRIFPNLERLYLVGNPITALTVDIGGHFGCLKHLSALNSGLSTWEEVDNLRHFPKLVDVQLRGSRILDDLEEKESRKLLVARLPGVTRLNNSPVSESERETAERSFIRKFMDSTEKPERYEELRKIHRNVHRLANIELRPTKNVTVTVRYEETSTLMTISTMQTLQDLKKELAKKFGLTTSKTRVLYLDVQMPHGLEELKDPTANLYRYNIRDGDEIVVEKKR